jgi:zinc protease
MKKTLFLLIFCFAFGSTATAQNIKFVEYDLPNGLKVILHEDHSTPIVAVSVMYHVGSKNENPERTGFAHFFEHLLFEGSENIKRGEFDDYISNAGGTNNANTMWDRTYYYEILPSNQLALGLWLESERMLHAKVEKIGIETQRQVVKEERRQRIDNRPYGSMLQEAMGHAFKDHPYKWPVIGSMAHLDAAVESDYVNFYKEFYVPNNAILSIAGDLNIEETKAFVNQYFSTIPRGSGKVYRPNIVESPLGKEVRDTIYDNIQLPAVVMTYRMPKLGTTDFYALEMLNKLLSQGESSRMSRRLKDETQKCVAVGSFPLPLEDPGATIAYGISALGNDPKDVENEMTAVIENTQTGLIPELEFQKLRNQTEAEFISSKEGMDNIAESLANYEMYYGDANLVNTELARYMAVTREDIQRVSKQYFRRDNRVVLYYLPKAAKP